MTVENRYEVLDLSHLRFTWSLAREGVELAAGTLPTPQLAAGEHGPLPLPAPARQAAVEGDGDGDGGELWLTVRAKLAKTTDWAPEGHVIAWGQLQLSAPRPGRSHGTPVAPHTADGIITLGPGRFDHATGSLFDLGQLPLHGPTLGLWRAPTDNDRGWSQRDAAYWKARGLDRLRHRTVSVTPDAEGPFWSVRVAPRVNPTVAARACAAGSSTAPHAPSRASSAASAVRHRLTGRVSREGRWDKAFTTPARACSSAVRSRPVVRSRSNAPTERVASTWACAEVGHASVGSSTSSATSSNAASDSVRRRSGWE
ncbi:beta-galactosidase domain 4-containing protein [Kitasatospora sp. NPDC051914]|uniref:DUF4981 domain-containing protein n=1 Tax=Kitasatospora sp. NPDC051914 TaxID=3154945 RepID=UPI003418AC42